VAATDDERRRLERDLHDGAQQRLVTLAIEMRLARRIIGVDDAELDAELADLEAELTAVGELREIAHGIFPSIIAEEGLGSALAGLAERSPRLLLSTRPTGRCPATIEAAAYFLVADALRRAPAGEVTVDARREAGSLVVDAVAERGFSGDPTASEDRIGAVGGVLSADAQHLRAELPCGS
jgi:signal transduction histidine kinase